MTIEMKNFINDIITEMEDEEKDYMHLYGLVTVLKLSLNSDEDVPSSFLGTADYMAESVAQGIDFFNNLKEQLKEHDNWESLDYLKKETKLVLDDSIEIVAEIGNISKSFLAASIKYNTPENEAGESKESESLEIIKNNDMGTAYAVHKKAEMLRKKLIELSESLELYNEIDENTVESQDNGADETNGD